MDYDLLKRLVSALEARGVVYAIFGAVALNLHGIARFTEDIDLFIAPEPSNIDRLKQALRDVFRDPEIDTITTADLVGEYSSIRYVPPDGSVYLDVVTRLGDAFNFSDLQTRRVPLDDLTTTVVSPETLYRMKRSTVRLKDRADAEMLRRLFGIQGD